MRSPLLAPRLARRKREETPVSAKLRTTLVPKVEQVCPCGGSLSPLKSIEPLAHCRKCRQLVRYVEVEHA